MGIPRKILRWRRRPHDEKSETDGSFLLKWGPPPLVAETDILVRVFPNDHFVFRCATLRMNCEQHMIALGVDHESPHLEIIARCFVQQAASM
jgi:hypothetical protein